MILMKIRRGILAAMAWLAVIFAGGLLLMNLILRRHPDGEMGEMAGFWEWMNPLYILGAVLIVGGLYLFIKSQWFQKVKPNKLLKALMVYAVVMCIVFVAIWQPVIRADSGMLHLIAQGENHMEYLLIFPQQIPYMLVMKATGWLFANEQVGYLLVNLVFLELALVSLDGIVRNMFKSEKVRKVLLLLLFGFFPLMQLALYAYNDMIGLAMAMAGVWMALEVRKDGLTTRQRYLKVILMILAMGGAVIMRQNALVIMVAVLIYLVMTCKRKNLALTAAGMAGIILVALGGPIAIKALYSLRTGENFVHDDKQFTVPAFVAMGMGYADTWTEGMEEEYSYMPEGWYTNYAPACVLNLGRNECDQYSKELISKKMASYVTDPIGAAKFYIKKQASQWNDGTFQMPYYMIYYGDLVSKKSGRVALEVNYWWDNCLHLVILAMTSIALAIMAKLKKMDWTRMLPILAVMGYFAFSIIWEAKSRYILLVFPLMLPYASYGLSIVCDWLQVRIATWRQARH